MSSALLFGEYLLLGRIHQSTRIDYYIAKNVNDLKEPGLVLLARLRSAAKKGLPYCADIFLSAGKYLASLNISSLNRVLAYGEHEGQVYWVRPFIPGRSLHFINKKCAFKKITFPENIVAYIGCELAKTLPEKLASNNELTEGISQFIGCYPRRIMISDEGAVINTDLGLSCWLSQIAESELTDEKWRLNYTAPEEIAEGHFSPGTPCFTLGAVLYELLTGSRLFAKYSDEEAINKIKNGEITRIEDKVSAISPEMAQLVTSMLSIYENERPQADEIITILQPLAVGGKEALLALIKENFSEEIKSDKKKEQTIWQKISDYAQHKSSELNPVDSMPDEMSMAAALEDVPSSSGLAPEEEHIPPASLRETNQVSVGDDDPFGNTIPANQLPKIEVRPQPVQPVQSLPASPISQAMPQVPYIDNNYNMMQQMYNQQPTIPPNIPPMMQPAMPLQKSGMSPVGILLIILSVLLAGGMILCSILYVRGQLPAMEKIGLPPPQSAQNK